jgi:hypothetical protein
MNKPLAEVYKTAHEHRDDISNSSQSIAQFYPEFFRIFRNKKIVKTSHGWREPKRNKYLTDNNIYNTLIGVKVYGWFLRYSADVFSIDIDLHKNYLSTAIKAHDRIQKYNYITERLGIPSLLFQSSTSGGLHVYYKIDQLVYYKILLNEIYKIFNTNSSQFKMKGFEVRPTPSQGIRIPHAVKGGGMILDPETLHPVILTGLDNLQQKISEARIYSFSEIFDTVPEIQNIWIKQKTQLGQFRNYQKIERLRKYEQRILPLIQGQTNEQIEKLSFNCYANKLDSQEAYYMIEDLLQGSRINLHLDTQGEGLKKRIECHYVRFKKNNTGILNNKYKKPEPAMVDLFQEVTVRSITDRICAKRNLTHKGSVNRLRNFVNELYRWTNYIKKLSKEESIIAGYQYRYFYYLTKVKKWTPLPKVLLKKWNGRSNQIMDILKQEKIIELKRKAFNPYKIKRYNPAIQGICNYFKVNL